MFTEDHKATLLQFIEANGAEWETELRELFEKRIIPILKGEKEKDRPKLTTEQIMRCRAAGGAMAWSVLDMLGESLLDMPQGFEAGCVAMMKWNAPGLSRELSFQAVAVMKVSFVETLRSVQACSLAHKLGFMDAAFDSELVSFDA